MRAIILAAGQGTRLRPHTNEKPKCMVDLVGKPLLHRQLETMKQAGIENIKVIGGYCADRLEAKSASITLNPRYAQTNMVSTLFCAEDWMQPDADLLITYGDIVYEVSVLNSLISSDAPITISIDCEWQKLWRLRMEDPLSDAETLKLTDTNRVVELGKKPETLAEIQGQYMGLIKVRQDMVMPFREAWHQLDRGQTYDGKDFDNMYMTSFLQHLIDQGVEVRAAFTNNKWLEVDTAEDLAQYERLYHSGALEPYISLTT